MKILLCIDDTDTVLAGYNTEKVANYIIKNIHYNKYGIAGNITKHKLLCSKEINYTKDNYAYCIEADVEEDLYMEVIKDAEDIISENAAIDANPGIGVIMLDKVFNREELIRFGEESKVNIMKKRDALFLALRSGLYLKERGGDGSGAIGALAGLTLRLSGNDGIFCSEIIGEGNITSVAKLKEEYNIDIITLNNGEVLNDNTQIFIKDKAYATLKNNKKTFVVENNDNVYIVN
ncbi:MAG: hypothetical protein RR838_10720 [Clostridium sp.]